MHPSFLVILLLVCTGMSLQAQSKPVPKAEWEKAYEVLQNNAAKALRPLNQLLQNELEAQHSLTHLTKDPTNRRELEAQLAQARIQEESLSQGHLWHPGRQEAAVEAFCQQAAGKKWTLKGTRQVRHFRLEGRDVVCITDSGRESRQLRGTPLLPGVFITRRTDGGATVYMPSPDMKQALCLVAPRVYDSLPKTSPLNWHRRLFKEKPGKQADLLTFLTTDLRNKQRDHEKRLIDFLELELREARAKKYTSTDITAILRELNLHRRTLDYLLTPQALPSSTAETFAEACKKGGHWLFPGPRSSQRLQFDGKWVRTLDAQGKEIEIVPAEIIWPGLIRMRTASGTTQYIATSTDLQDAQLMTALSQFPGTLAE